MIFIRFIVAMWKAHVYYIKISLYESSTQLLKKLRKFRIGLLRLMEAFSVHISMHILVCTLHRSMHLKLNLSAYKISCNHLLFTKMYHHFKSCKELFHFPLLCMHDAMQLNFFVRKR